MTSSMTSKSSYFKAWFLILVVVGLDWWTFFVFQVFRSKKSFQLLSIAWSLRVTLKLKVTLWSTWLFSSLLVFILPRWFVCCFVRFLGLGIHSIYRRSRDHHAWPWNWRSRQGPRDFCYFGLYWFYRDDCFFVLWGIWFREFILTVANCVIFTLDLEKQRARLCLRDFLFCQVVKARRPWRDLMFQGHTWWSRKWQ